MRGERIGRLRVGDDGVGTPAGHAEDRRRQPRIARPVRQFPLRAIGEGDGQGLDIRPVYRDIQIAAQRIGDGGQILEIGTHTSELQSLMRISYAVFCLKKKKHIVKHTNSITLTKTYSKRPTDNDK